MDVEVLDRAVRLLEQANGALSAAVMSGGDAQRLLARYVRLEKLAGYGTAMLAARVGDASEVATLSGTSVGQARRTIETGRVVSAEPVLAEAMRSGGVSPAQAEEIARTVTVAPGSVDALVATARSDSFLVLKERARSIRVAAEERAGLGERQHAARRLRHWVGELGMVHLDAVVEPHVGARIVDRLGADARRRAEEASRAGSREPLERHLADAFAAVFSGHGRGSSGRTELVVLVSHEVARRGWRDVGEGEHCKIPGIGPIAPSVAKQLAEDAFLSGVFFDGTDLRHLKRWTRHIPQSVRVALGLGAPPDFDGPACVDCGRRFRLEVDHQQPYAAGGPTSLANNKYRCPDCHEDKTIDDLREVRRSRQRHRQPPLPAEPSRSPP